MNIVVNPGTGPVKSATSENAYQNIPYLIQDAQLSMAEVTVKRAPDLDENGRYGYELCLGERICYVEMPGLPLEQVKYTGAKGQSAWDFPRLYVAESSWLWKYAMNVLREQLMGNFEDDEDCVS